MFGFPTQLKYLLAPLILVALVLILQALQPWISVYLGFYPEHIANGEIWRVISGQLLHTNFHHTLLNIAGLALVWALHGEYYSAKHYSILTLASLSFVGLCLALTYSDTIYSGLSGIIHTMIIYGAILDIRKKRYSGYLICLGIWLKVAYEMLYGASASTSELIEARVAVEAHLIGTSVGMLLALTYWLMQRNGKTI